MSRDLLREARSSSERLRRIFDSQMDPFVLLEPVRDGTGAVVDLRNVEANTAAGAYHRVGREELLGRTMLDFYPGLRERGPLARYIETALTGVPTVLDDYCYENEVLDDRRWYDLRAVRVADGVGLTWRDVTDRHLSAQALARSERQYRLLVEHSYDVVVHAVQGVVRWISPSVKDLLGLDPSEMVGRPSVPLWHPDDVEGALALREEVEAGRPGKGIFRIRHRDGHYLWVEVALSPVGEGADGEADGGLVTSMRDVSARRQADELLAAALRSASIGMAMVDLDGRFRLVNPALCRMVRRSEAWLLAHAGHDLVHPDDRPHVILDREHVLALDGEAQVRQLRLVRADGGTVWVRRTGVVIRDSSGEPSDVLLQIEDVTAEHDALEKLTYDAFHDALTGLRNRAWILDMLETELRATSRSGTGVAVLFIDIDNFKVVNDSLGHSAGDEVLTAVAGRLSTVLRPADHVGRFGGDEFIVVVPGVTQSYEAERVAERLLAALGRDLTVQGHRIVPAASIGIALSTPESTATGLLRDADSALFRAKSSGRSRWRFFDERMHAQAVTRLTLEDELRRAVAGREFAVHYQPIVTLPDGVVVGHEALLRWNHPRRGLLGPSEFLAVAEDSRLIVPIGEQVLDDVCALLAARKDLPGTIAVNVSGVQLTRPDWAVRFRTTVDRHGVDPARLVVEVTETAVLATPERTREDLATLRRTGVEVHVDDFGTGYSSISLLRDLPVTGLKLDARFVRDLADDDGAAHALAAALVGLADGLGLVGIGEGIETRGQADVLAEMGWPLGQGYLFGRPRPQP